MKVVIIAAGGLGRTIADILARCDQHEPVGFCDDNAEVGSTVASLPVLGPTDQVAATGAEGAVVAVGNGQVRQNLAAGVIASGLALPIIIDPTAVVSPSAALSAGVVVGPHATIGPNVRIERLAIVSAGAVIEHDAVVQEACYVGPRCLIDARAHVAAGTFIKGGTIVGQDERIG